MFYLGFGNACNYQNLRGDSLTYETGKDRPAIHLFQQSNCILLVNCNGIQFLIHTVWVPLLPNTAYNKVKILTSHKVTLDYAISNVNPRIFRTRTLTASSPFTSLKKQKNGNGNNASNSGGSFLLKYEYKLWVHTTTESYVVNIIIPATHTHTQLWYQSAAAQCLLLLSGAGSLITTEEPEKKKKKVLEILFF